AATGKHLIAVRGYVDAIPRAFQAALIFPMGTGSMNLDSPRYELLSGISTSGGTTLVQWAAQNGGIVGLGMLAGMRWRRLGLIERTAGRVDDRLVRAACLGVGGLAVTSVMTADMLLVGPEGTLLVGWLLGLARSVDSSAARS